MLLGRQGRREGLKGSLGRRETFKGSLLLNVAFWNQKKIWFKVSLGRREAFKGHAAGPPKASGSWRKNMLLDRQGKAPGRAPGMA